MPLLFCFPRTCQTPWNAQVDIHDGMFHDFTPESVFCHQEQTPKTLGESPDCIGVFVVDYTMVILNTVCQLGIYCKYLLEAYRKKQR
jgi:hypothetical protein